MSLGKLCIALYVIIEAHPWGCEMLADPDPQNMHRGGFGIYILV